MQHDSSEGQLAELRLGVSGSRFSVAVAFTLCPEFFTVENFDAEFLTKSPCL